jgi:sulfur carrier protein ThiS
MEVNVTLFGNLGYYVPEEGNRNFFTKTLPEGATVEQLLREIKLPTDLSVLVVVNSGVVGNARALNANDAITIFRAAGGG